MVENLPVMQATEVQSLGREDPLEEGMATHSSILAWRIPWTEEPGGLQSMGLQSKSRTEQLTLTYTSWVKGVKHGTSLHTGLVQLLQPSYCSIFYHQKNF